VNTTTSYTQPATTMPMPAVLTNNIVVFKQELITAWIITFLALNGVGFGGMLFAVSCGALWLLVDKKADLHSMITFTKMFITKETPVPEGCVRLGGQFAGAFIGALLQMILADDVMGFPAKGKPIWILLSTAFATAIFLAIFFKTQEIAKSDTEKAFWFMIALLPFMSFATNPVLSIATNILQKGGPAGDFIMVWLGPFVGVIFFGLLGWGLTGEKPAMFAKCGGGGGGGGTAAAVAPKAEAEVETA